MSNEYVKTIPFNGRAAKALEFARTTFASQDFQILATSNAELRVKGVGLNSTDENPLKGVSEAHIIVRASTIEIKADLGGARWLGNFAKYFPLILGAFLIVVFVITFGTIAYFNPDFRQQWVIPGVILIVLLSIAPSVILSPMMARRIEKKTKQAVDTLLNNMAVVGRDG